MESRSTHKSTRSRTSIRTILNVETILGEKPRTFIKYVQYEKVSKNGELKVTKVNKLTVVKHLDSEQKNLSLSSPSQVQSDTNPRYSIRNMPNKKNKFKPWGKTNVGGRKYFYIGTYVLLISILLTLLRISLYTEPIQMKELQYDLSKNIVGQDSAIKTILDSVEQLRQSSQKKILTCLIGSTGLGKTYSINILKKHVDSRAIHMFQSQDLTTLDPSYIRYKMINSDFSILVLDDLKKRDLEQLKDIIENIMELKSSNILIIAIFNIQEADSHLNFVVNYEYSNDIKLQLERLTDYFFICEFNELNVATVEDWLKNKLIADNIDQKYHSNIIAELLKIQDIKNVGLKGIHQKLLLELTKYQEFSR